MDRLIQLTSEELEIIKPILENMSQEYKKIQTLDRLYYRWSRFVNKVVEGYNLTIDDYTNDLCIRDLLQIILTACPKLLRTKLEKLIEPLDNLFLQNTKKIEDPLLSHLENEQNYWWWYRIPITPGDE